MERQLSRIGHLSSPAPKGRRAYAALAQVSPSYSPFQGRLPTCYSPVRRSTRGPKATFALDLHVSGTPPAFILSQDQTLQLNPACARSRGIATRSSAVIPALVASGNEFRRAIADGGPRRRAASFQRRRGLFCPCRTSSPTAAVAAGNRRGLFLYSVFKEPAFVGRAPLRAEPRLTPPAATCPRPAVDYCPRSAERR